LAVIVKLYLLEKVTRYLEDRQDEIPERKRRLAGLLKGLAALPSEGSIRR
jgi:hypothetical protein